MLSRFSSASLIVPAFAFLILFACGASPEQVYAQAPADTEEPSIPLSRLMDSLGIHKESLSILIDKSDYTLTLRTESRPLKEYPMVLGTNPVDDKLMQGDRSTPEGHFSVRDFYPHKRWSKFIWIDYPTKASWVKHNQAKSDNRIPADAAIGGEIGIHGTPDGQSRLISERVNWTWGCISLTNEDVDELFAYVYKGMPIEIVP